MDSGFPAGRLAAHDTPGALRLDVDGRWWSRTLRILSRLLREHHANQKPLPKSAQLWLWPVIILDVVAVAWMCAAGVWVRSDLNAKPGSNLGRPPQANTDHGHRWLRHAGRTRAIDDGV